ncbi:MAG: dipeptidase [candidate division WOR-3 bacterium]
MAKTNPAHYQKLHQQSLVIDMHCDSILRHIEKNEDISKNTKGHLDLPKMIKGGLKAQVFAIFPDPKKIKPGEYERFVLNAVRAIKNFCKENSDKVGLALSPAGLKRTVNSNRIGIIIGVEGGHALEGNLARLFHFWRAGVRILTITWCNSNELADASWDRKKPHNGISELGRRAIRIMNRLGMIVDVSHSSERSFYQLVQASRAPVIASHSGVYALRRHNRNLKLNQLQALKERRGLMGQAFLPGFLNSPPKKASIDDVVKSIDFVVQRFGPDIIGLGSDFDGFSGRLKGLEDASMLPEITKRLIDLGYKDGDIKGILGLNFLRVWENVWQKRG